MRLILTAVTTLVLGGCFLYQRAGAPANIPSTSVSREIRARFQGTEPQPGQLFVCGLVGNPQEFWCLDYFIFQEHVDARAVKTGAVSL